LKPSDGERDEDDPESVDGQFGPQSENEGALLRRARAIQLRIEKFYGLEAGPDVGDFVHQASEDVRESLLLRQAPDAIEMLLLLPSTSGASSLDHHMQLVEGVSHFVYVAERARIGLPATALELELQAEVDKFVLLALDRVRFSSEWAHRVRQVLFDRVRYLHGVETEHGRRYRLANDLAAKVSLRISELRARAGARSWLMRFYRSGQTEKIRLARAA